MLLELAEVPDVFISGVGKIDILGQNMRVYLYVDQVGNNGELEHVVVARIVMPIDTIPTIRTMIDANIKNTIRRILTLH